MPRIEDSRSPIVVSRRQLLGAGSLALMGLSLPELLAGRAAAATKANGRFGQAKSCILLFMWGGPAHQDTWDLKPDAPAEIRGEFKPIATKVPGIQICEHFPQLSQRTDKLAIIRSMTHDNVDHLASTHFLLTGQPPLPGKTRETDWPHLGAVLSRLGRGRGPLPPFVSMRPKLPGDVPRFVEQSRGQWAGWLGQTYDPLVIDADPSKLAYHVGDFALPGRSDARDWRIAANCWRTWKRTRATCNSPRRWAAIINGRSTFSARPRRDGPSSLMKSPPPCASVTG